MKLKIHNIAISKNDDLIFKPDIVSAKVFKKSDKQIKKPPKHIMSFYFENKRLAVNHLSSISHENDIINCLPESL